jgi:hypothetical protein
VPALDLVLGLAERVEAEPTRFERTRQQDTADIVHAGLGIHGVSSPVWSVRAAFIVLAKRRNRCRPW